MNPSLALTLRARWHELAVQRSDALSIGNHQLAATLYAEMIAVNVEIARLARGAQESK